MRRLLLVALLGCACSAALASAAGQSVTIAIGPGGVLQGRIASNEAGQTVLIQGKECGIYPQRFRDLAEAHTGVGGGWAMSLGTGVTTTFRAIWNGRTSSTVVLWAQPLLRLQQTGSRKAWDVTVVSKTPFWRKRVRFERWDRARSRWQLVRWVTLTDSATPPGAAFANTAARFSVRLPPRALVRAVLPTSQARPCYRGVQSKLVRAT